MLKLLESYVCTKLEGVPLEEQAADSPDVLKVFHSAILQLHGSCDVCLVLLGLLPMNRHSSYATLIP